MEIEGLTLKEVNEVLEMAGGVGDIKYSEPNQVDFKHKYGFTASEENRPVSVVILDWHTHWHTEQDKVKYEGEEELEDDDENKRVQYEDIKEIELRYSISGAEKGIECRVAGKLSEQFKVEKDPTEFYTNLDLRGKTVAEFTQAVNQIMEAGKAYERSIDYLAIMAVQQSRQATSSTT